MFSIIVPSYNRKEEIPALLESLTKQTTYNFDVVIVDDCSKEPVEVTQSYPFAVKVIRNETNQGAAESRNIGARNAEAAKQILKQYGIRLVAEDTGLNYGRTVELHCDTGEFLIKSVGKPIKTI